MRTHIFPKLAYHLLAAFGCMALCSIGGSVNGQTVQLTDSNLPIVVIETHGEEIPDDPKITADMGIIFNGTGARNRLSDPFNHYDGKIGIEIRGQSSQMFPMKSYSIELRNASGDDVERPLFGFPKESDWVLYAPYTDKTLMRNVLAYQMSRDLGHWAARCIYVEVILNGEYRGVYVFMERIKRDAGRVNIPKLSASHSAGDEVTGGYIFSLDKEPNGWFSKFQPNGASQEGYRQFSYVEPKPDDITGPQKAYLESYVDSFEAALAGPQFQDPATGVRRYADLSTFIDYFIVNEVSRNVDGYRLSTYLHKSRNSIDRHIKMGPVWDYDLAFRNADYCRGDNTRGWSYEFNEVCPGDPAGLIPFWWDRLMEDTAYVADLRCRWKSTRQGPVSTATLYGRIDSIASWLDEARQRHFERWPVLGQYVWPNPQPIPGSYPDEIRELKSWLGFRLEWIDANLPNSGPCTDFPGVLAASFSVLPFPNPSDTEIRLRIYSKMAQTLSLRVVDMQGRVMTNRKLVVNLGENEPVLGAAQWPGGLYFVEVVSDQKEVVRMKVIRN